MEPPYSLAAGCRRCNALVRYRSQIVHGYGDPQAKIIFVGEAPELPGSDKTGVPFTGSKRGQRLLVLLCQLGLAEVSDLMTSEPKLQRTYLTYLVRCLPPNRAPAEREVANCTPYLWHEIAILQPRILVAVGELASHTLCAKYIGFIPSTIRHMHAQIYSSPYGHLVPMIDPLDMTYDDVQLFLRVMSALIQAKRYLGEL